MYLRVVAKDHWCIYEICDKDGKSPFLSWYSNLNPKYSGSARRLMAIIKMVAETTQGPTQLSDDISHEADKKNSIYQFIAGDLRLLWFYSNFERKIIICGGQHIKQGQKAKKIIVNQVIDDKKEYSKAFTAKKIIYYDKEGKKSD